MQPLILFFPPECLTIFPRCYLFLFQPIGFCGGAVYGIEATPTEVKVSCEIFHPQVP